MSPTKQHGKPLSPTEWRIMNICWRLGQVTARQVWEASLDERDRDYQTVKTLLDRIVAKGYLAVSKDGTLCVYSPVVEQRRATADAVREFVEIVLDRGVEPLLVHLAEREELGDDELEALERLLERESER